MRKMCPCSIEAKHNPNWKPTICACVGGDGLYEECGCDYDKYKEASLKRYNTPTVGLNEFISREGVVLTPEMMKDLTCISWPSDSVVSRELQKSFEKRMEELFKENLK